MKRFLREIHKDNDRQERETQRAKSEVERLRQVVTGGPSATKTDGNAVAPAKRTAVPVPKPAERPVSLDERKKQMAQLAEMGVAIPQEYRADMALAGEWQTLSETKIETADTESAAKSMGIRKRKHQGDEDEDELIPEQYVSKGWGSRMKVYPDAQDDDGDLDSLLASTKDLKKAKTEPLTEEDNGHRSESVVQQKKEVTLLDTTTGPLPKERSSSIKAEATDENLQGEDAPGIIFKKRKPKTVRK